MFLLNSRLGLFIATSSSSTGKPLHHNEAPLLPKLRGYFAEFLNVVSLAHLRLLASPTCVGLRYGRCASTLGAFLGSKASMVPTHQKVCGPVSFQALCRQAFDSPAPYDLRLASHRPVHLAYCVPPSLHTTVLEY